MTEMAIKLDEPTEMGLRRLSEQDGSDVTDLAARLLARAVRATRPRPAYDLEAIRAAVAEFGEDEVALAESGMEERAQLLAMEDQA